MLDNYKILWSQGVFCNTFKPRSPYNDYIKIRIVHQPELHLWIQISYSFYHIMLKKFYKIYLNIKVTNQ